MSDLQHYGSSMDAAAAAGCMVAAALAGIAFILGVAVGIALS